MSAVVELLGGILRYFPNMVVTTLFVGGVMLGKIAWIMVAIGAIVTTIVVLTLQYVGNKAFGLEGLPGAAVIKSCSVLPDAAGGIFFTVPSLWISISAFLTSYIFMNAQNIYRQKPAGVNKEKLAVQQRKGLGLISMLTVSLLFLFLLVPRWMTNCESIGGMLVGLGVGIGMGVVWWRILEACGSDVYPDIHGIMIGLRPGTLHTTPAICEPKRQ